MPFPKDLVELNLAGYRFESKSPCKACSAEIHWYRTNKNRLIPMRVDQMTSAVIPHFADCPGAAQFKRKSK